MPLDVSIFLLVALALAVRWGFSLRASAVTQAVAIALILVASCLVSLQVLGVYSALTRQPVVTAGLGATLLGCVLAFDLVLGRGRRSYMPHFAFGRPSPMLVAAGAISACSMLLALRYGLTHPPIGWDLQHYHLPRALNIMQSRTLTEYYPPAGYTFQQLENALGFATIRAYPGNWSLWLSILAIARQETLLTIASFPFALIGGLAAFRLARLLGADREPATLAMAGYVTAPLVLAQGVHPYADMFCATWILVALMFLLERPQGAWCYSLAGLSLGLALGAKSTSLIYALVLGVIAVGCLIVRHRRARMNILWGLGLFVGLSLLPSAFWFGQDWILYGSPVLPFQLKILGVTLFPGLDSASFGALQEWFYVNTRTAWLLYPWREKFNLETGFGWCFATLLPLAAVGMIRAHGARRFRLEHVAVSACCLGTVAVWWKLTHHEPRYMLQVVGLVSVLGAVELGRLPALARNVALTVAVLGLGGNCLGTLVVNQIYHQPNGTRNAYVSWLANTPATIVDRLERLPPGTVYYAIHDGPGPIYYALYGSHFQHRLLDDQNLLDANVHRFRDRLLARKVDYLYTVVKKERDDLARYTPSAGFEPEIVTESGNFRQALFRVHPAE